MAKGMAGYARGGQGRGTAGISKVTGSLKAGLALGKVRSSIMPIGTEASDAIPVVDPVSHPPVLSPPVYVDLACMRPSADAGKDVTPVAMMLPGDPEVGARPIKTLPGASPTLPQVQGPMFKTAQ